MAEYVITAPSVDVGTAYLMEHDTPQPNDCAWTGMPGEAEVFTVLVDAAVVAARFGGTVRILPASNTSPGFCTTCGEPV